MSPASTAPLSTANMFVPFVGDLRPMSKIASSIPSFNAFFPHKNPVRYAADVFLVDPSHPIFLSSLECAETRVSSPSRATLTICDITWLFVILTTSRNLSNSMSFNLAP